MLSIGLTILVGFGLLNLNPAGLQASWADPVLQAWLAGIAGVAFVAAWVRGAFRRMPPATAPREPDRGSEGAWELQRRLDLLRRQRRRLEHELRAVGVSSSRANALKERISDLEREDRELRSARQAEYAR